MSEFSDSLKRLRGSSGKTQSEVAEYLGFNILTYKNYEVGQSEPSITRLIKLANLFMVSLDELVDRNWIGRVNTSPSASKKSFMGKESQSRPGASAGDEGDMGNFPDFLKQIRKKSNKTQSETARYLGITLRTYQNYEGGKSEPSMPQFINMANFFMVSLDELVGRDWSEY